MSTAYPDPNTRYPDQAAPAASSGSAADPRGVGDTSVGELFGRVSEDLSTLIRQEMALAKAEAAESAKKAGKGIGMFGGAGVAGHFVLLFLSLALWWALGAWIGDGSAEPALGWAGLIVAVLWGIVAAVLALTGKKNVQQVEGIPQTTDTVKKIPTALKGQES
jgi:hypothetical protein